jgi:hypothetical protein
LIAIESAAAAWTFKILLGQALQSAVSLVLRSTAKEYFADTPIGLLAEVEC